MHSLFVVGLQELWSGVCRSDLKHLQNGFAKWLIGFYDRVVYKTCYMYKTNIKLPTVGLNIVNKTINLWGQRSLAAS